MHRYLKIISAVALMFTTCLAIQATTFTVTTPADGGEGSLRWAIEQANSSPGADTVAFGIPGTVPFDIQPQSPLPPITEQLVIDGTTQPGFAGTPIMQLEGSLAGDEANGLHIQADGCTVKGLVIGGFKRSGIFLDQCDGNSILGNFIGTTPSGLAANGNGLGVDPLGWNHPAGILIVFGDNNVIGDGTVAGRNLISGNEWGIHIAGDGSFLVSTNNRIEGNYIGTDLSGTTSVPNFIPQPDAQYGGAAGAGIHLNYAAGSIIKGNLISGNASSQTDYWRLTCGITGTAPSSRIEDNRIGTDASGQTALANQHGVNLYGPALTVRNNLISGNEQLGIRLCNSSNLVEGNVIGLDEPGTSPLPNGQLGLSLSGADYAVVRNNVISCNGFKPGGVYFWGYGIEVMGRWCRFEGNYIGTDKTGTRSWRDENNWCYQSVGLALWDACNVVGGTTIAERNVLSGNYENLWIGSASNRIVGNYIGPDVSGNHSLGSQIGIKTYADAGHFVFDNIIGGSSADERNLISGNLNIGVGLDGLNTYENQVVGNFIGTDASGAGPLPNGVGVEFRYGAHHNILGGESPELANVVAYNGGGVSVSFRDWETVSAPIGNRILGNSIHDSGWPAALPGYGIWFSGPAYEWSILPNDLLDQDIGPNKLQNYPVVTSALTVPGQTTVTGTLSSEPNSTYRIECFANPMLDPSGYGEGQLFLGFGNAATDNSGNASFAINMQASAPLGWIVTATATDADGNSSPFSGSSCVIRDGLNSLIVTTTADDGEGSLRQAILTANSRAGRDTIYFNIPGSGPHTIQPLSPLPTITEPVVIDGYSQPGAGPNTLVQGDNAVLKIELDGTSAGSGNHGLIVTGGGSTIRGLVINRFGYAGIWLEGVGNNTVAGNFLGTDVTGGTALGNVGHGVAVLGCSANRIGGTQPGDRNLIAGSDTAVVLSGASDNVVQGNYIGTDASGTKTLSTTAYAGIRVDGIHDNYPSRNNLIGGTEPGAGNLISGHGDPNRDWWTGGWGIEVYAQSGTRIQGNLIGTDATGTSVLGNTIGVNVGFGTHLIGGTEAGAGNLISGNRYDGIYMASEGNLIQGNLIGTDVTGSHALGNGRHGLWLYGGGNVLGGVQPGSRNVVSGNGGYGMQFAGAPEFPGMTVQGNYFGTDVSGTQPIPNQGPGIFIGSGTGSLVGGTTAATRNVVLSIDIRSTNNVIQGNYIGVDVTGTKTLVSQGYGIYLADSADENQIGGTAPGAGNLICGWDYGIHINGRNNNRIQGNTLGSDSSGTVALGNVSGIVLSGGSQNLIGGTELGAGNVVVASRELGIWLGGTTGSLVQGNYVGTDRTGSLNLGNQYGVYTWGCQATKLGGTESGAANVIAFSQRDGVYVIDDYEPATFSSGNSIRGNAIHDNGGLGINLLRWGTEPSPWDGSVVTLNDAGDADIGPNGLQNYPIIESVTRQSADTTITGSLNSTHNTSFTLDFYSTLATDPSNHGEGDAYLGAASVTTDANGDATFSVTLPVAVPEQRGITATATDPAGNTSEFSRNSNVPIPPQGTILYQWWLGVEGSSLSALRGSPDYPDHPSESFPLSYFEAPQNRDDNFGARMRGTITATASGEYTFWIASDDDSQLWLSTDDNPANKRLIASVTGWTDVRQWDKYPSTQQSAPIQLTAGQTYYVETLYKEAGGGDHCAVAWRQPGSTADPEIVPGNDIVYEYWSGIPDPSLSALIGLPAFPDHPTGSSWLLEFEAPSDWADNYGVRISGILTPPADGEYTFWIASDDDSELWLSTDGNPGNKRLIASVSGWTGSREWNRLSTQQSVPISMVAGTGYYIEALHKEGGGGDHLAAAWQRPDGTFEVIPGSVMSPYVANQPPTIACPSPVIAEATSPAGADTTLTVNVQDPDGDALTVTWTVNGTVVKTDSIPAGTPSAVLEISLTTPYPLGENAVTVTVGDGKAEATCQTSVNVQDTTPPSLTMPGNITAEATSPAGAVVTFAASAHDVVSGAVAVSLTPPSGSAFPLGATTVTAMATDAAGNTATATFTVTVVDTTAPTIQCSADIYLACSVDALVPVNFSVTATDSVDLSPTVICTPASGSGFAIGETTVTCTATDASGNTAMGSFKVIRAALEFTGFLPPIGGADATGGSFANPVRTFKAGSTIPVKFAASCVGTPVLTGAHRLQVIKFTDATTSAEPIDATPQGAATAGNQFRLTDGQWHFNLDTKATGMTKGIWQLIATLSDGSQHMVWIALK